LGFLDLNRQLSSGEWGNFTWNSGGKSSCIWLENVPKIGHITSNFRSFRNFLKFEVMNPYFLDILYQNLIGFSVRIPSKISSFPLGILKILDWEKGADQSAIYGTPKSCNMYREKIR
jgi:hypothetical protein